MIDKITPFSERLEKALEYRKMRPVDLSAKTSISQSTISQYLSGYAEPKKKRLTLIADILNVNPTWLMGIDVPMERMTSQIDTSVISSEFLLKDETVALLNDDSLQPVFEVLNNADLKPQLVTYANFLLSGYEEKGRD